MNNKPAKPLPWPIDGSFKPVKAGNMRYALHAANAYPRLVEALKSLAGAQYNANTEREFLAEYDKAHALLRDLGEDA